LLNLYMPLNFLGFTYREIRQSFIDMEKMIELRAQVPDIADTDDSRDLPPPKDRRGGQVSFEQVAFQHTARSSGLQAIDFPATPSARGGPPGSGKTTTVGLALRLIDPKGGPVRLDGVDLRQVRKESLHKAIALVPQDVALFNNSLYANIAFAQPDATPDQVR